MRWRKGIWALGALVVVLVAAAAAGPLMSRVEEPSYKVLARDGSIELRAYPALTLAQTTTQGDRAEAIGQGFQRIAGYIFGKNAERTKVAMTAPVMQQRAEAGGRWTTRFVMPAQWSPQTLPKPDDADVRIASRPAATYAVIRFSGFAGNATLDEKERALRSFIAARRLDAVGAPIYAFYNPPWTLPFLRRNEIMIEIAGR